ncbi:bifunctional helix-turn-helix transcriptional regulator/GNAT family N-acetyltransferase [Geosporobacter ferrireducens]|uniref:MarR family transcriptional regulator n=1 Tax=Geosporobacter ferrireducens TaxID=1424294 RepID=A0A1D8GDP2_9FIRM|nr:helix-turn-helix domain-containing GNAT family N-acetyltransferase [Geosporobacter ferrireducens]AOT68982.1 MarR family transcriptional regulator [Geosporobacter ferrireducens]MTI54777.1 MarR family transcriptional regulator [Geosporobacter ferrireducens]
MISADMIAEIMGFNRFYSNILNLLNKQIMAEGYSLTETRVLFEIGKTDRCTANILVNQLDIDRSYMSRMIARFEKKGIIDKTQSPTDSRINYIRLTEKGRHDFNRLNDMQSEQITHLFHKMNEEDQKLIFDAMIMIKNKLSDVTDVISIRPFTPSDIEYVISRHKTLYYAERHLSNVFFNYVDRIVYQFANNFNPKTDCLNILECNGNPAGSIAVVKAEDKIAQIRFFMLEPEMRGRGYGNKLMDMALDFCREKKYKHVFLLTISAQVIARHIYERRGFRKTDSYDKSEWGESVVEERWDLEL